MPAAAGAAVALWAAGAGASAATAALVGAVATAAVSGAIVGGVLGAVTSVISGGNILEGTLKGALIGGVIGGVTGGIGHLVAGTTAVPAAAAGTGGGDALAGGLTAADYAAIGDPALSASAADVSVSAGAPGGLLERGASSVSTGAPVATASVEPLSSQAQVAKIMAESGKHQMIAGGVQGLATSAGAVLAGKDKAKSDKELADALAAREDAKKAGNLAGDYQSLFREYTLPENWIKSTENLYDKYKSAKKPLLAGGVA